MFFTQAQNEYLEVSFLRSNIVSLNPSNETILSIESEVATRIVTCKVIEDCAEDTAVDMFIRQNILVTDKDSNPQLELKQSYRWMQGALATTLLKEARYIIDDSLTEKTFRRAATITSIPAITILSITTHNNKKRARE